MSKFILSLTAVATLCAAGSTQAESHHYVSSAKMIGQPIYGTQQERLADVNSIVINKDGTPLFVVAGVGGVAGIGESEVAIPWSAIKCDTKMKDEQLECHLSVPMTSKQFENAPKLEAAEYAELYDEAWLQKNAHFYAAEAPRDVAQTKDTICVSSCTGADVQTVGKNKPVATVESLAYDTATGKFEYLIIGYGGTVGIGRKYTAVPMENIQVKTDENECVCHIQLTEEQLEKQPVVTPANLPELELESVREKLELTQTVN